MRALLVLGLCLGAVGPVLAQVGVITISPPTLPDAVAGVPYSQTLTASGGTAPYTFTLATSPLPPGMTLSPAGVISGTTLVPGSYGFLIIATDAFGVQGTINYVLQVNAPIIVLAPAALPAGVAGTPYSQTLTASGGGAPYTFAVVTGTLPAGVNLTPGGLLSGTPTVAGSFGVTVQATDANGFTGSINYTLAIAAPTIVLAPATLPAGVAGTPYSQTLTASGGGAPYSFAVTAGALPAGLTLSAGGVLSGTPTVAGSFGFTVTATDASGFTGAGNYTLAIAAPTIVLAPATLPAGQAATAYNQTLAASGGTGPYTFAITAGALPAGLTLSAAGVLSGATTSAGSFAFTVTATDANGFTGSANYTLLIGAPTIALTPATLPAAPGGTPYSQTLTASGGTGPYTFAITAGALPAGLALDSGGLLDGTPTAFGSFNFTVTATDANGFTGAASYTLAIAARPDPTADPDVNALIDGQVASTRNFANAQILNFHDRLERLHVAPESDWGYWIGGSIRSGDRDPRGNASSLSFETWGVSGGIDYNFSNKLAIGFGGGYGRDRTNVGQAGSRSDSHAPSAISYLSWHPDLPFFIDGLVAYQDLSFDLRRITANGSATLLAVRDGKQRFTSWSSGYEYQGDDFMVGVYGRADIAKAVLDDYSEQGDPVYALHFGDQDILSRTSTLGLRYESTRDTRWGKWERRLRLELQRDFHVLDGVAINYANTPSGPVYFTDPAGLDRNRVILELGSLLKTKWGVNLRVDYHGVFGGMNGREHWLRFSFDED